MKFSMKRPLCALLLGLALSGAAWAGDSRMPHAPGAPAASASSLLELKQRLTAQTVRELRTSYNGDYGTTLLLAADAPVFYVALLHQKSLWRVLRFSALAPAEQAYVQFSQRSADWADDEIRLQALNAQSQALERSKQESEARLAVLNNDMQIMQSEQARIQQGRLVAQSQAKASEVERRAYQIQLDNLKRNIRQLEAELGAAGGSAGR
ncbi:MAG: putative signal peptide protein [Collimonas fungivorans]|uniref:DUF2968 domain-containing protein n=1 Tax=Collimonas fungivorans TaxID=158899 RepID=UPI0026F0461A|nr:DUF2968 domain-containing protein [Collimonas fungivorans]MDB5765817.1 putative signal peptide protein [Collimonas fungivorans]